MSAKAICEATGKGFLNQFLDANTFKHAKFASVLEDTNWDALEAENPWLKTEVNYIVFCCFIMKELKV